ncbi:MAG TPA: DUF302 domain-containing protein, partial [Pyrinomonadaceae bacterium]|nr:DUF302 domain-containing protein [Pyrinomonadaceae bacterium]
MLELDLQTLEMLKEKKLMDISMNEEINPKSGLIEIASKSPVAETFDKLEKIIASKGMRVFARINHAAEALAVGLEMRLTEVLIFGNPKAGTPLMNEHPLLAIDLPLKVLAREGENGQVWLVYNNPLYLQKRFGLEETPFRA